MEYKYIGDKRIKHVERNAVDTVLPVPVVEITYTDETKELLTEKMFHAIASDGKCDATALRDKRCQTVVQEILRLFSEYNIKISEVQHITTLIVGTLNERLKQASDYLWQSDDLNRTIRNLVDVLQTKDGGTNQPTS
jgi:hypothetical protein